METCPICGHTLQVIKDKPYDYSECGLNVVLHGITQYYCDSCGESFAEIPDISKLHRLIGANICTKKKAILKPAEIKFLRKNLQLKAKELAKAMGVNVSTFSRWENGKKEISDGYDRLLRSLYMMYASEKDCCIIQEGALNLFRGFPDQRKHIEQPSKIALNPQEWMMDNCVCAPTT